MSSLYKLIKAFTVNFDRVALAMWLLSCIMLVTVPRYGAYLLSVTGFIMNAACLTYYCLRPANPLVINFEDTTLTFGLGGAFWTVLFWGECCIVVLTYVLTFESVHKYIRKKVRKFSNPKKNFGLEKLGIQKLGYHAHFRPGGRFLYCAVLG